jgi:hypothetical protein
LKTVLGPTLDKLVGAELGAEDVEGFPLGEAEGLDDKEGLNDGFELG